MPEQSHRCGLVALTGRPNSGKSTLLNAFLRQRVASISPRPQTTRRRQMGILTLDKAQVLLLDTPGLHKPANKLDQAMQRITEDTVREADLLLYLIDLSEACETEDRVLIEAVRRINPRIPAVLVLNKKDLAPADDREARIAGYRALWPEVSWHAISAASGAGLPELLQEILDHLPEGQALYPEEDVTDLSEREIAADLIREAALCRLREEVPHGVAVAVEQFRERDSGGAYIEATLFVERESHKPILIGRGGAMLKQIGTEARKKIEEMSGRTVFLDLRVKVLPRWRNQESVLRRLGYLAPEQ